MKGQDRRAAAAGIAAGLMLWAAAFAPPAPRGAWWCTAFSVTCREAGSAQSGGEAELRSWLADWWHALAG